MSVFEFGHIFYIYYNRKHALKLIVRIESIKQTICLQTIHSDAKFNVDQYMQATLLTDFSVFLKKLDCVTQVSGPALF